MDLEAAADALFRRCRESEQAVRVVESDADAAEVRRLVRSVARREGLKIRTARMDDRVVVVRCDAALWTEPTAVMRAKLDPGSP